MNIVALVFGLILLCGMNTLVMGQYYDAPPPEPEPNVKFCAAAMTGYNTLSSAGTSSFIGNSNMLMFGVRVGKRSYLCAASYREAFNTPIPNLTNETYPNLTGVFAIEYRHEVISRVHGIVSLGAGSSASDSTVLRRGGYVARFSSSRMWIPHASLGAAWTGDGKPISFVIEGRIAALGNPYSGGELIVIPSFRVGLYFTNH